MMSVRKPDSDESGEAELKRMLLTRIVELESKIEGVQASLFFRHTRQKYF
jgi:hypothetical protein